MRLNDRYLNRYVCNACKADVVTIQPGIGNVPYWLKCRSVLAVAGGRPKLCEGFARSQFYDVPPDATPTWEFYSPQVEDVHSWFDKWKRTNNQLAIRKIENA